MDAKSKGKQTTIGLHSENTLFPVMSAGSGNRLVSTSLFPSAVADKSNKDVSLATKLGTEWLTNKSFTDATAERVKEFEKELNRLQNIDRHEEGEKFGETDNVSLSSEQEERTSPSVELFSQSDNSESTHREERKKKKNKHKEDPTSDADDSRWQGKRKKKSKHKKHKRHKQGEPSCKSVSIPGLYEDRKHIFLDEVAEIAPKHPFKLDREPDKCSWSYGSLYSGNIANYKSSCENCVGNQRILLHGEKKKYKTVTMRYFQKENRKLIKQLPLKVISAESYGTKSECRNSSVSSKEEYIPVDHLVADFKVENKDIREKILDQSTSLYVQGIGEKGPVEQDNCDTDIELDKVMKKIGEFNRLLRETPSNVKLWLDFVKFQDTLSVENVTDRVGNMSEGKTEKKITQKALLEKKISIVAKALENNPGNIELLLTKIELNSEVTDSSKTNKELEQLLFVHPANTKLWKYYLVYNQSRLAVFTVSRLTKLYHKCFKTLIGICTGKLQTHTVPNDLEKEILDIFLQYCYFLKQVGHKERAVALFQAMLEFNLFCPQALEGASMEDKMAAFEEFWDECNTKLGTAGAQGWRNHYGKYAQTKVNTEATLEDLEEDIIGQNLPKDEAWLKIELLREHDHWLPWQPDLEKGQSEDDCEDPERLVVFDDVKPVIFEVSKGFHFQLVLAFLEFLSFTSTKFELSVFENSVKGLEETADSLVESYSENVIGQRINLVVKEIAVNLLQQLRSYFCRRANTVLTLHLLEIQLSQYGHMETLSKTDKKEMRKILKYVLKEEQNRSNLKLWCAYIDLERIIGKPGESKGVAETALTMHGGKQVDSISEESVGLISLYGTYCEILLGFLPHKPKSMLPKLPPVSGDIKKVVIFVLSGMMEGKAFKSGETDPEKITGSKVLKMSSLFLKEIDALIEVIKSNSQNEFTLEKLLHLSWCQTFFTYCTCGLEASLKILSDVIKKLENASTGNGVWYHKQLHERKLRLILYHMAVTPSPLSNLRHHLDMALDKYPNDLTFLSLFVDIEEKSRVTGSFNRSFDRWCRTLESPEATLMAVTHHCELLKELKASAPGDNSVSTSGLVHRARNWLENSLKLPRMQHCPLLWRLYLRLESTAGSGTRLEGIFYRAVQQCPWAKSLYMDGVELLGSSKLQEIVDLMTEKELRIQIPVEELDILMKP